MSSPPRIAIIGAGPAGCTLGRLLHLNNICFTIFEGEASSSIRSQGSTLDLHRTALEALKACQLYDDFRKNARYDGEAMVIADKNYNVFIEEYGGSEDNPNGRPEIDRSQLRGILADSLPEDAIRWGHRLRRVEDDGALHFDYGVEKGFDLVVGADGAWSKIRPLVSDVKPEYTGLGGIGLTISNPQTTQPDLYRQVNRGSVFAFSDGKGLQPQQLGDGSIHMYTWSKRPEDWMSTFGFDPHDSQAVRNHLAEVFHDWHPQLVKFTQVADEYHLEPRNLYMLPVGHSWHHRKGFTLIGDAAHLMTPFAGEGVNLAIVDAHKLARAIIEGHNGNLDKKVQDFEEEMFVRVKPVQQETKDNLDGFFNEEEGSVEATIVAMLGDAPPEMVAGIEEQILKVGSERAKKMVRERRNEDKSPK